MRVLGIEINTRDNKNLTTLHVIDEFNSYEQQHKVVEGQKVEAIYVGNYNCDAISVGSEIEIIWGRARGSYQPIKRIDILN